MTRQGERATFLPPAARIDAIAAAAGPEDSGPSWTTKSPDALSRQGSWTSSDISEINLVAKGGIEPPTRGFSTALADLSIAPDSTDQSGASTQSGVPRRRADCVVATIWLRRGMTNAIPLALCEIWRYVQLAAKA
jgi:hypothetical protein